MLSLSPMPKFILLNLLRAISCLGLLFVFIANAVLLAEDVKAIHSATHDKAHEDCDYIENSGVPNQPLGEFRAFFSLTLNIIQCIIFFLAELGFPKVFFKNWIPCLYHESLVALGVLQVLLAAQVMSHFLELYPLFACFWLLIAGLLNITTMYVENPKSSRTWGAWRRLRQGLAPSELTSRSHSRGGSYQDAISEKEAGVGFGRNGSDHSHSFLTRPVQARLSRTDTVTTTSSHGGRLPPNYTPSPRSQFSGFGYTKQ